MGIRYATEALRGNVHCVFANTPCSCVVPSQEIKPGMIELMKPKYTFTQSEIQDGDIICFQVDISDKEVHDLESQGLYSNPQQFYDFLQNRVMVLFRPKFDEPDTDQPEFSLVLSKKQNYDAVSRTSSSTSRYWTF
jgi:ubiquitin carboxyl-terminal hydrolase 7